MLKRSLFFEKPCRLSMRNQQLIINLTGSETRQVPIEDIGFIVIDNQQISITIPCMNALVYNNVAIIYCNDKHLPISMLMSLDGNHVQGELFRKQIDLTGTQKGKLWKQTIEAKIKNQMIVLKGLKLDHQQLHPLLKNVKVGDSDNREGAAARLYWSQLFGSGFVRDRFGDTPNELLNYGYTLLRAATARALIGSGILPSLGIFHKNRYNAYPLADDIMEPYRPFVDMIVHKLYKQEMQFVTKETKAELMHLFTQDVKFKRTLRPLMVGLTQTTASLARYITEKGTELEYPELVL